VSFVGGIVIVSYHTKTAKKCLLRCANCKVTETDYNDSWKWSKATKKGNVYKLHFVCDSPEGPDLGIITQTQNRV
jgi:hypothetical protein